MLDASSKFPFTGLGYASETDLGNFDQCMTIDHSYENGQILGEYCRDGLIILDKSKNSSINKVSICNKNIYLLLIGFSGVLQIVGLQT